MKNKATLPHLSYAGLHEHQQKFLLMLQQPQQFGVATQEAWSSSRRQQVTVYAEQTARLLLLLHQQCFYLLLLLRAGLIRARLNVNKSFIPSYIRRNFSISNERKWQKRANLEVLQTNS